MEEIEKQRSMQREEEKKQREHEAALDRLRTQRTESQRKDLETLQVSSPAHAFPDLPTSP